MPKPNMADEWEYKVVHSFQTGVGAYFTSRQVYTQAHVLLIHWQENDFNPEKEIDELRECFEQRFKYTVTSLPLPKDGSQQRLLNREIGEFVHNQSPSEDSLIVVYYAGHCAPDENGLAEWAAFLEGGPTVQWHVTQQLLFAARGDVLLILDCCHASLIMNGKKETGRFELLAACATGRPTPFPSSRSFSNLLVKELQRRVEKGVFVGELASILRETPKITETPVFHDFARHESTNIKLHRLEAPQDQNFMAKPSGYIFFRVSLSDDLTGLEIANWLKTASPMNITAVRIEAIVTRARGLQGLAQGLDKVFPTGSVLGKLSQPAQTEIIRAFRTLDTTLVTSSQLATDPAHQGDSGVIEGMLESIESSVDAACEAVETPVLAQLNSREYDAVYEDDIVKKTGTDTALSLHEIYHDNRLVPENEEIPREQVDFTPSPSRFNSGTVAKLEVVIETYRYVADPTTSKPYEETLRQVRKMTSLLCHPKARSFHILPCLGFFHDKPNHTFGLAFKTPPHSNIHDKPVTLLKLYNQEKRVSLGHRIRLACALTVALDHFHTVGWVHKGIRSENIAFSPLNFPQVSDDAASSLGIADVFTARQGSLDLARPYLFGFEYMRMGDAGTNLEEDHSLDRNLYRHPDRWGRPLLPFEKAHDIHALGVVLVEIAFWQNIRQIAKISANERDRQRIVATELRESVLDKCHDKLPHMVGDNFYETVLACLEFQDRTKGMDTYEAQKYFQIHVVGRIQKAAGRV
ncbi:hypothetical protein BU16DRAFT_584024 [Lophium mytilinum]|uniref:Protein kinase domain-containing protein n=1 Tax=Lophium mytilinum TaxID=390894 RepID=A0A6A6QMM0_9PEZI|nr:hypothetical protein BU16DRAFT_584024 [Lophium mytilinum]